MLRLVQAFILSVSVFFMFEAGHAQSVAPQWVDGAQTVTLEQAKILHDKGVIFIDLRSEEDYAKGHIALAINQNIAGSFDGNTIARLVEKDEPVVFYCYGIKCLRSYTASIRAVSWGYQKVKYFRVGLPAWEKAGYPIETGKE